MMWSWLRRTEGGGVLGVFACDKGHVLMGAGSFFSLLFVKVNRPPAGVWGVMGKEETVMLIRTVHTSPSNNKTKQEGRDGKATDNSGGGGLGRG